jgi:predicted RNase H-like nuclease (RuvC/YqgF family)
MQERNLAESKSKKHQLSSGEVRFEEGTGNNSLKIMEFTETNGSGDDFKQELYNDSMKNMSQLLRNRINNLESELTELSTQLEKYRSKNEDLQAANDKMYFDINRYKNDNSDDLLLMSEKNDEIARLRKKIASEESESLRKDTI